MAVRCRWPLSPEAYTCETRVYHSAHTMQVRHQRMINTLANSAYDLCPSTSVVLSLAICTANAGDVT